MSWSDHCRWAGPMNRSVLLLLIASACADPVDERSRPSPPGGKVDGFGEVAGRSLLIYGHRGAPWSAIENTLASYAAALREGANAIELDVCVTADGAAVIW